MDIFREGKFKLLALMVMKLKGIMERIREGMWWLRSVEVENFETFHLNKKM